MTVLSSSRYERAARGSGFTERVVDRAVRELHAALDAELARRDLGDRVGARSCACAAASIGLAAAGVEAGQVAVLGLGQRLLDLEAHAQVQGQLAVDPPVVLQEQAVRDLAVVAARGDLELAGRAARASRRCWCRSVGSPSRNCAHDCARSFGGRRVVGARVGAGEVVAAGAVPVVRDVPARGSAGRSRCGPSGCPHSQVTVGAIERLVNGRLKPAFQSERCEPSDAMREFGVRRC